MKILIGIGFALFIIFLLLALIDGNTGVSLYLTPAAIFGGSSLIAIAIHNKK